MTMAATSLIDRSDINELAERLQEPGAADAFPRYQTASLCGNNGRSLRMTVMKEAWDDAGRSVEEPGDVLQLYFPQSEILIVDLS